MRFAVVYGDRDAQQRLEDTSNRARDLHGAWEALLPALRREEREIFITRGHGRWPANRPATIRRKGRNTPMFDSGRLYRALTIAKYSGSVSRPTKTQLTFGVNDRKMFYSRIVGEQRRFIVDERTAERLGTRAVKDWLTRGRA